MNYTVEQIVKEWLFDHCYTGLFCEDCGCEIDDLMPCSPSEGIYYCEAGYKALCSPDCDHEGYYETWNENLNWHIQREKP